MSGSNDIYLTSEGNFRKLGPGVSHESHSVVLSALLDKVYFYGQAHQVNFPPGMVRTLPVISLKLF